MIVEVVVLAVTIAVAAVIGVLVGAAAEHALFTIRRRRPI